MMVSRSLIGLPLAALLQVLTCSAAKAQLEPAPALRYVLYAAHPDVQMVSAVDTATNTVTARIDLAGLGPPIDIAVAPNGTAVYVLLWGEIAVIDAATDSVAASIFFHGENLPNRLVMSPRGDLAYASRYDTGTISIIDTATATVTGSVTIPTAPAEGVSDIAFTPDGRFAYVVANGYGPQGDDIGVVYLVDTASRTVAKVTALNEYVSSVAVSADERLVYVTARRAVVAIGTASQQVEAVIPLGAYVHSIAANPNGATVYALIYDYTAEGEPIPSIAVIDAHSLRAIGAIDLPGQPRSKMLVSADGAALYVAVAGPPDAVAVLDTVTGRVAALLPVGPGWASLAIAPAPAPQPAPTSTPRPTRTPNPPPGTAQYRIYVVSPDAGTLTAINASTNEVAGTTLLAGPYGGPVDVAVTPDGAFTYVAMAGRVLVVDTATNRVTTAISTAEGYGFKRIAMAPDGGAAYLVNPAYGTVSAIATATNQVSATIADVLGYSWEGLGIAFDAAGTMAYVASSDNTADDLGTGILSVIDTATYQVVRRTLLGRGARDVALRPDGRVAYVASGGVTALDPETLGIIAIIPVGGTPGSIAFTPDGAFAYVTVWDYRSNAAHVAVVDATAHRHIASIPVSGTGPARRIAISPDGRFAYVTLPTEASAVAVIDTATDSVIAIVPVPQGAEGIAIAPAPARSQIPTPTTAPPPSTPGTTQCVYVAHHGGWYPESNVLSIINPATATVATTVAVARRWDDPSLSQPVSDTPNGVVISPDGNRVYVAVAPHYGGAGTLAVVDAASAQVVDTVIVGCNPSGVAVRRDGASVYVSHSGCCYDCAGAVSVIDTATNTVRARIPTGESPTDIAITPGGQFAYVLNSGSASVSVIDLNTDTAKTTIPMPAAVQHLAMRPDGQSVYVTLDSTGYPNYFNTVAVIDTATNTLAGTITVPVEGQRSRLKVSPGGSFAYLAISAAPYVCSPTSCFQKPATIAVIDTATQVVTATIPIGGDLSDVAFSAAGERAYVTDSQYGTVSVIDTATHTVTDAITVADAPGDIVAGLVQGDCQASQGATRLATRTMTPTMTPSPTVTATNTRVPTRTRTPSPTPTATIVPAVIAVGAAAGAPGTEVSVGVTLAANGHGIAGVQNDIGFDPRVLRIARSSGAVHCRINPEINKGGHFAFQPPGCGSDLDCDRLRALVVAPDSTDLIPDGALLYTCTVEIAPDAAAGTYTLVNSNVVAAAPGGQRLEAIGANGEIVVMRPPPVPAPAATLGEFKSGASARVSTGGGSAGGCAIAGGAASREGALWFLAALALAARRRASRRPGR